MTEVADRLRAMSDEHLFAAIREQTTSDEPLDLLLCELEVRYHSQGAALCEAYLAVQMTANALAVVAGLDKLVG